MTRASGVREAAPLTALRSAVKAYNDMRFDPDPQRGTFFNCDLPDALAATGAAAVAFLEDTLADVAVLLSEWNDLAPSDVEPAAIEAVARLAARSTGTATP